MSKKVCICLVLINCVNELQNIALLYCIIVSVFRRTYALILILSSFELYKLNSVGRNVEETLRLIKAFQYSDAHVGEACPASWQVRTYVCK